MISSRISQSAILSVTLAFLLSACATAPVQTGRVGLLERGDGRSGVRSASQNEFEKRPDPDSVLVLHGDWQWPFKNVDVSSGFGQRGRKFHQGIDLRGPVGTPVYAAASGKVVYVGNKIRGYGRMVVLKHDDNVHTIYAHHSKNLIKLGAYIERGEQIALSGRSGRAHGPHLHFEIRKGTVSYDPELALNQAMRRNRTQEVYIAKDTVRERTKSRTKRFTKTQRSVSSTPL